MGAFNINITGVGGHGCERKAKTGEKLYGRCGKFTCPDCMAFEFVQRLKQAGMVREGDQATGQEIPNPPDSQLITPLAEARACLVWGIGHPEDAVDMAKRAIALIDTYPQILEHVRDVPAGAEIYHTDAEHRVVASPVLGGKTFWKKPHQALFTHWPDSPTAVVDDLLKNERVKGQF